MRFSKDEISNDLLSFTQIFLRIIFEEKMLFNKWLFQKLIIYNAKVGLKSFVVLSVLFKLKCLMEFSLNELVP